MLSTLPEYHLVNQSKVAEGLVSTFESACGDLRKLPSEGQRMHPHLIVNRGRKQLIGQWRLASLYKLGNFVAVFLLISLALH